MIPRHEICHAYEVVRQWNNEIDRIDTSISLLIDENLDGETLNETLEQLQLWIATNCTNIKVAINNIVFFINGYDSYDLTAHTNLDFQTIFNAANFINRHATDLATDIFGPQITTKEKLAKLIDKYSNSLPHGNPVVRSDEVIFTNRVNIYIDTASHTLRQINDADGVSLNLDDFAMRTVVSRLLEKAKRLSDHVPLPTLQADMDSLVAVADYVLNELPTAVFTDLADYIDANTEKVPLFRRRWMI